MADFPLMLKSTIDAVVADKVAALLATHPTLKWAEVDDMAQTDAVFKSEEPAFIWKFVSLTPNPRAPMYDFEFLLGAKTTNDPGNYKLIALLDEVRKGFETNATIQIRDYSMAASAPADTVDRGYLMVSSNEIEPQRFDRQSGIRYATVMGKVVAYG